MLIYLTKTILLLSTSYVLYKFLLEDTTGHRLKRYYLLVTLALSMLLPIVTFEIANTTATSLHGTIVELNDIVINNYTNTNQKLPDRAMILWFVYGAGSLFMLYRFGRSLYRLRKLDKRGTVLLRDKHRVVLLHNIQTPFSFWKTIYAPLSLELTEQDKMYLHELEHVKQFHSLDIVFVEVLKVVFWFNPFVYLYQQCIALNHEFLADQKCVQTPSQANEYLQLLLQQTYLEQNPNLCSSFHFNLTKKRFLMITKKSNPLKNASAIVVAGVLFCSLGVMSVAAQQVSLFSDSSVLSIESQKGEIDKQAEFPAGYQAFVTEFSSKFVIPKDVKVNDSKVIVSFTVNTDGTLSDFKTLKDPGHGIGDLAIEVIRTMPKWNPAVKDGVQVASEFVLPITFKTE